MKLLAAGVLAVVLGSWAPASAVAAPPATEVLSWRPTPTGVSARPRGLSAADLQFHHVEAFDVDHAVVPAIGPGEASTTDDGVSSADRRRGLVLGDPVDDQLHVVSTEDGERSWRSLPVDGAAAAIAEEGAFTAGGLTWRAPDTSLTSGPSAGGNAVAFRALLPGVIVRGAFTAPTASARVAARTSDGDGGDGGDGWREPVAGPPSSRSVMAWLPHAGPAAITVDRTPDGACWADGEAGRVARLGLGG
ncbi:hypothetical protein [Streptoalloteichus hindustanus]|uniref:PQQ-like domain-containing protein n=1 Tax=Streptoalloteichus hindustanus TaxID=2017 RepID=A0A1M5AJ79_STRHI|nr:hypothetical protein [Streptoalloteichus hindustanus]SHF30184.1 hypothetical protein SAMN05444320_103138 [Streptoalloteichus hindustanus]